jgi:hypothetical protein
VDFALDPARSAAFDPSHVTGFAVRLRTGSPSAESTVPSDGGTTVVEIDDVTD